MIPPKEYKWDIVKEMGKDFNTLVETGTYMGEMIWANRNNFSLIHSIELFDEYYHKAVRKFSNFKHIHIHYGDSSDVLKELINDLPPSLFWLDAHYSGGRTAKGKKETPIKEELEIILASDNGHGILIDDARCFGNFTDFPTLDELRGIMGEFELENDIIWKDLR